MSAVSTQKRAEPPHTLLLAAIYNINKVCFHRSVESCASFRPDLTDRRTRARFAELVAACLSRPSPSYKLYLPGSRNFLVTYTSA
jgi:hypothetical protein